MKFTRLPLRNHSDSQHFEYLCIMQSSVDVCTLVVKAIARFSSGLHIRPPGKRTSASSSCPCSSASSSAPSSAALSFYSTSKAGSNSPFPPVLADCHSGQGSRFLPRTLDTEYSAPSLALWHLQRKEPLGLRRIQRDANAEISASIKCIRRDRRPQVPWQHNIR